MMEITPQSTVPVDVASQQVPPQAERQTDIRTDLVGAAQCASGNSVVQQTLDRLGEGIPYALEMGGRNALASAQTRSHTDGNVEDTANVAPEDDPIAMRIRRLLPDWTVAAQQDGDTACDAFYLSTLQTAYKTIESQVYFNHQCRFALLLGELPEEVRMKALRCLLALDKGNAVRAVKRHLAKIEAAISPSERATLDELLRKPGH